MIEIDKISHLVTLESEYTLQEVEKELSKNGFTLGYFVPPRNEIKIEEALSQRMKNLYLHFYGDIINLCVSLKLHSQKESNIQTFLTPRQAAGPDWKNFILGSGDSLGFIYQATFKIFQKPKHFIYLAVGLAHDIASHQLEQEFTRAELVPWVFGRFGNMQVSQGMRIFKCPHLLLTAWAGTKDWVDACRREVEARLEGRYAWKWIEGKVLQKDAHKLLHEKYPLAPWGGPLKSKKQEGRLKLEKDILKALSS